MVINFMNKYRINIIYNSKGKINDIFAKVLSKELSMICSNKKMLLSDDYFLKNEEKHEMFK